MKLSIKKQFLLLFLLVIFISLTLLSFILRTTVDNCFYDYKWAEQSKIFDLIVSRLETYYAEHQSWDEFNGNELGKLAMKEGCYFTLTDNDDNLIWTSEHFINNQTTHKYWRNIYPVNYQNQMQGKVYIGQFTENIYTQNDRHFKDTVLLYIIVSLITAILLVFPFVIIISHRLSKPILSLKNQAESMIEGDLNSEITTTSYTAEIVKLSQSLERLRKSLLQQEELRRQLASNISHELRTPLNVLQNQLEAIIDGIFEASSERLDGILQEVVRLTSLVAELENISAIESTDFIPEIKDVKLAHAVENVCTTFEAAFQRKGIDLNVNIKKGIIVKAQEDKLKQLIINIISNALKYTDKGSVTVSTYMQDDHAVFEVKDSGVGLTDDDKEKIFERFYRVEKSRNRNTGGAGLGLSIVKTIADAHLWKIEVKSDGVSGTTFKVHF